MKTRNNNLRNVLIFSFVLLTSGTVTAQKMRFKDIYPLVENKSFNEAVPKLRDYLVYDPPHPSANFQLALIYEMRYTSYDILTQNSLAIKNATQAQSFFYKANTLIDEREVRRNSDYYSNFSKPNPRSGKPMVEYVDVREKLDNSIIEVDTFLAYAPQIHRHFTAAASFYEVSKKNFLEINNAYATLKDLYLKYNKDLEAKLLEMEQSYDSALFHFEAYKSLTNVYSIKYNQSLTVKPITLYRLDGLVSESTFLDNQIAIWNYATWSKEVRRVVNNDIQSLRKQIASNHLRINNHLTSLTEASENPEMELASVKIDRDLLLKLKRYDNNSIVAPILNFQLVKQELLFAEVNFKRRDSSQFTNQSFTNYAAASIVKLAEADSLLRTIRTLNNEISQAKYQDFIKDNFGGQVGLMGYLEKEKKTFEVDMVLRTADLRDGILKSLSNTNTDEKVTFKKMSIPFSVSKISIDSLKPGQTVSLFIEEIADGSFYLAGMHRNPTGAQLVESFVAKLDNRKKIKWVNSFNIPIEDSKPNSHVRVAGMQSTAEGIVIVLHAMHTEFKEARNILVTIDENGKELSKKMLANRLAPRSFVFLDRTNTFLLAFKGEIYDSSPYESEKLILESLNAEGENIWTYQTDLAGTIDAIIPQAESFILIGNYSIFNDPSGRSVKLPSGQTNAYTLKINNEGKEINRKLISGNKSYYITQVNRTGQVINLLGFQGLYEDRTILSKTEEESLVHIIIDTSLTPLYQLI